MFPPGISPQTRAQSQIQSRGAVVAPSPETGWIFTAGSGPGRALTSLVARIRHADVVQALQALLDDFEEPRQFGSVRDRTGRGAKHEHRVPRNAVDGYIHSPLKGQPSILLRSSRIIVANSSAVLVCLMCSGPSIYQPFCVTFSPSSTSRRMASERPGWSSCFAAHASTLAINSSDRRMVRTGSFPVAGRPAPARFPPAVLGIAFFI